MLKVDLERCTGCGACVQKCPQKCIQWLDGEFGFRFPYVETELCVHCNCCTDVCPIDKPLRQTLNQRAFAVVYKNLDIVKKSTSGGAFTAIALYIIEKGGIIYGCSMEDNLQVQHIRVKDLKELEKLHGSKYVQSNLNNTYREVEKDLKKGFDVLFTGTPCQVAGLCHYLGSDYDKLITVDIVCHGVGSQSYFDKFIEGIRCDDGNVKKINFRSKKYKRWACTCGSMTLVSSNGDEIVKPFLYYKNYYYFYFLHGDIYRKSCYRCRYASIQRQADFTLGDFWGVESLGIDLKIKDGCSLLLLNNKKASNIFIQLKQIEYVPVTVEDAARMNAQLSQPSRHSLIRDDLIKQYEEMSAWQIGRAFKKANRKEILKGAIKERIPYNIRLLMRKVFSRFQKGMYII